MGGGGICQVFIDLKLIQCVFVDLGFVDREDEKYDVIKEIVLVMRFFFEIGYFGVCGYLYKLYLDRVTLDCWDVDNELEFF